MGRWDIGTMTTRLLYCGLQVLGKRAMEEMPGLGMMVEMQMSRLSPSPRRGGRKKTTPVFAPPTSPGWEGGGGGGEGGEVQETTIPRAWLVEHAKVLASKAGLEARVRELRQSAFDGDALVDEIQGLTERVIALEEVNMDLRVRAQMVDDAEARAAHAEDAAADAQRVAQTAVAERDALAATHAQLMAAFRVVLGREKSALAELETATDRVATQAGAAAAAQREAEELNARLEEAEAVASRVPRLEARVAELAGELEEVVGERDRGAARFAALRKDFLALKEAHAALGDAHRDVLGRAEEAGGELRALKHSLWSRDVEYRELKRALKSARQETVETKRAAAGAAKKHKAAFRDATRYAEDELAAQKAMLSDARDKLTLASRNVDTLLALLTPLCHLLSEFVSTHDGVPRDLVSLTRRTASALEAYHRRIQDPEYIDLYSSDDDVNFSNNGDGFVNVSFAGSGTLASPLRPSRRDQQQRLADLVPVASSPAFVPSNTANPKVRKRNYVGQA